MTNWETILSQIKRTVNEVDPSADVILFGSRARGDAHVESDWDILILTDRRVDYDYRWKMAGQTLLAELNLNISIGTIIRNREDWKDLALTPLYQEVQRDGKFIS